MILTCFFFNYFYHLHAETRILANIVVREEYFSSVFSFLYKNSTSDYLKIMWILNGFIFKAIKTPPSFVNFANKKNLTRTYIEGHYYNVIFLVFVTFLHSRGQTVNPPKKTASFICHCALGRKAYADAHRCILLLSPKGPKDI